MILVPSWFAFNPLTSPLPRVTFFVMLVTSASLVLLVSAAFYLAYIRTYAPIRAEVMRRVTGEEDAE